MILNFHNTFASNFLKFVILFAVTCILTVQNTEVLEKDKSKRIALHLKAALLLIATQSLKFLLLVFYPYFILIHRVTFSRHTAQAILLHVLANCSVPKPWVSFLRIHLK